MLDTTIKFAAAFFMEKKKQTEQILVAKQPIFAPWVQISTC